MDGKPLKRSSFGKSTTQRGVAISDSGTIPPCAFRTGIRIICSDVVRLSASACICTLRMRPCRTKSLM